MWVMGFIFVLHTTGFLLRVIQLFPSTHGIWRKQLSRLPFFSLGVPWIGSASPGMVEFL